MLSFTAYAILGKLGYSPTVVGAVRVSKAAEKTVCTPENSERDEGNLHIVTQNRNLSFL